MKSLSSFFVVVLETLSIMCVYACLCMYMHVGVCTRVPVEAIGGSQLNSFRQGPSLNLELGWLSASLMLCLSLTPDSLYRPFFPMLGFLCGY